MLRSVSWFVLSAHLATVLLIGGLLVQVRLALAGDKLPDQAALADAKEDVTQALLAETHGDNDSRAKRLTKAWLAAPELPEANWHLARIRVGDAWRPVAEIVSQAASDPDQAHYRSLRDKAAGSPRALRDLARLCAKLGWQDRARLHYAQLLANHKSEAGQKSEAVEKLELVQVGGQWLTKEEVAARQEEAKAIQDSLAKWRPKLNPLQQAIDGEDFTLRDKAIGELERLDDPTLIPALESFLIDAKGDFQEQAVKKLAAFPYIEATEALARYAVLSDSATVRSLAIQNLRQRPLHDYCPLLLRALSATLQVQAGFVQGAGESLSYVERWRRETPTVSAEVFSSHTMIPIYAQSPPKGRRLVPNPAFWKSNGHNRFRQDLISAELRAAESKSLAAMANIEVSDYDRRTRAALRETTGQADLKENSEWWNWWNEHNEYHWPKPSQYVYSKSASCYHTPPPYIRTSCFLAGTPVRAEWGIVPIESIQPGDRVLAQDQDTGELANKIVLTTTLRPPVTMLEIKAGGEDIYTTLGHPFWVAGRGWQMVKQLKSGDLLHGLAGATPIESVNPAGEHAAHNLVVDDANTYFVGRSGLLVHDNEFRKPTRAIVPGLVRD